MTDNKDQEHPTKIRYYNEEETLWVLGNPKASQVVFFQAGFPDDHQSFMPLASALAKKHDCLVGVACMPGYDHTTSTDDPHQSSSGSGRPNTKPEGYTFEELVLAMREAVRALLSQSQISDPSNIQLYYVFHDWGVVIGSFLLNQVLQEGSPISEALIPNKVVYLDVLPPPHREDRIAFLSDNPTPRHSTVHVLREYTYRVILASVFAWQRYVHFYAALPVFCCGMSFLKCTGLSLVKKIDEQTIRERNLPLRHLFWMMYPYYYIFNGNLMSMRKLYRLPKLSNEMPILYMYGTEKNAMLHDPAGFQILQDHGSRFKSEVVKVEEAGHWMFLHQAKLCQDKLSEFLFGNNNK